MRKHATGSHGCPLCVSGAENPLDDVGPSDGIAHMDTEATARVAVPFGCLVLSAADGVLTGIDVVPESGGDTHPATAPVLQTAARQLTGYFEDPETRFSLPLHLAGTPYMRRVWAALIEIPPGHAETYGSLARRLGSGPRAVAAACRANAFPIVIPCHRVVAAAGLGGYSGQRSGPMLEIKRWLLKHEGCPIH